MAKRSGKVAEETVRLTVYLPKKTHMALRIHAIEEGISTTKIVEGLIDEHLRKKTMRKEGKK
jgi:hypothetical protein